MTSKNFAPDRDIAIIGMAVRLPEADNQQQFLENLRLGRDSVRNISTERRRRTSMPLDQEFQIAGYLEDIDSFDYPFFGISRGEANLIAPEHRLLLQTTYQALENAGHAPESVRGKRVSVYVGDTRIDYQHLARTMPPPMVMGVHHSATAGRIARFLGVSGPAAMVDSSCSSGLMALHQAVNELILDDSEMALVSGVNINIFGDSLLDEDGLDLGVRSADGKTRTFAAQADGTGSGEAVVSVVLRKLSVALADGDPVLAVIKGTAVNNVADQSSSLTAPNSFSQTEVINMAWQKAGLVPADASYVEAHGTATRLGDPIEVEALGAVFGAQAGAEKVAVSSVKSNIGHTWSVSGLVGLIKAILALQNKELFPSVHAQPLSPLIDFDAAGVSVTEELTAWNPKSGIRRAGVSSFGIMGTCAHVALEEATVQERQEHAYPAGTVHWLPFSAKSASALAANAQAVQSWLVANPQARLGDLERTLVEGRDHFSYRYAVAVRNVSELGNALRSAPENQLPVQAPVIALIISESSVADEPLSTAFRTRIPEFDALFSSCEAAAAEAGIPTDLAFSFQYALLGTLRTLGLPFEHIIGEGTGKRVLDASERRLSLAEAMLQVHQDRANSPAAPVALEERVDRLLSKFSNEMAVIFLEAGPLSAITNSLQKRANEGVTVVSAESDPAKLYSELYLAGASWNWSASAGAGHRISLPGYQFDRLHCWLDDENIIDQTGSALGEISLQEPEPSSAEAGPLSVLEQIVAMWQEVLGTEDFAPTDSFF